MNRLNYTAKSFDMKFNVNKTMVTKVSRNRNSSHMFVNGQKGEQVSNFKYFSTWITKDGKSVTEIKTRLGTAKYAYSKKRKELLTREMSKEVMKKIVKILSIALYRAETWSFRKKDM